MRDIEYLLVIKVANRYSKNIFLNTLTKNHLAN